MKSLWNFYLIASRSTNIIRLLRTIMRSPFCHRIHFLVKSGYTPHLLSLKVPSFSLSVSNLTVDPQINTQSTQKSCQNLSRNQSINIKWRSPTSAIGLLGVLFISLPFDKYAEIQRALNLFLQTRWGPKLGKKRNKMRRQGGWKRIRKALWWCVVASLVNGWQAVVKTTRK